MSSFPNLVDLTAIRTDDELLDAIAAGHVDLPTDPIDYTLIQLLTLLAHGHTAPDHVVGQRRFGQTSPD